MRVARQCGWNILLLSAVLFLYSAAAAADPQPQNEETGMKLEQISLNLETNYWDLYPLNEAIYLQSLEKLSDGVGVTLHLRPGTEDFSHYEWATNDAPFQKNLDGHIVVRFQDKHTPEVYRSSTKIRVIAADGTPSRTYTIDINYYPRELYAASGHTTPGWLIVQNTDLLLSSSRISDWILQHPTEEDRAYARKLWGHLIDPARTDYENAMALAEALIDELEPHRGIPSDEMGKSSPFVQYRRLLEGKDRAWCGNLAAIYAYACNALDIPCRGIGMNHPVTNSQDEDYNLLLAEGHGTTEIFSKDLNQWVWIDLTFYALNASLGQEGPLNMAELYRFLNDPARLKSLRITVYDPKTRTRKTESVLESSKKGSLFNYFKRDQQFHYTRAENPAPVSRPERVTP